MNTNPSNNPLIEQIQAAQAEIKRLQQEITEREQQISYYQQLFEYTGDAILIIDILDMRIVDANDNAARRLGYTRDELLALFLHDIEVEMNDELSHSSQSKTSVYEGVYQRKDGSVVTVEISSRPLLYKGKSYLQNHVRDISRRKQMQITLEQSHRDLEATVDDLEAFSHMVAHDLKNPLQTVLGYAALLADELPTLDMPTMMRYVQRINISAEIMQTIIQELLKLASIRTTEEIVMTRLDMHTIIYNASERLKEMPNWAAVTLNVQADMPDAFGYPAWVEEVWANYISNAVKYGGDPPRITIKAYPTDDNMICYEVRDNGAGISAKHLPQLFQQFKRLDEERGEGHGLGLSIVKRIVEKLGGEVSVDSRVGRGSTFRFTLPAAD